MKKQELPQGFRHGSLHSLAVADLNGDGRPDVVYGQEELLPPGRDNPRWVIWENRVDQGDDREDAMLRAQFPQAARARLGRPAFSP